MPPLLAFALVPSETASLFDADWWLKLSFSNDIPSHGVSLTDTCSSDTPNVDRALCELVEYVNGAEDDLEIGLTLHLSGLVVSGLVISGQRYFELAAQELESNPDSRSAAAATLHRSWARRLPALKVSRDQVEDTAASTSFIHMRGASVFTADGNRLPGILWRGKVGAVSGWSPTLLT